MFGLGGILGYGFERERLVQAGRVGFDDSSEPWFFRDGDYFYVNVGAMFTFLGRLKVSLLNCMVGFHNLNKICRYERPEKH